DRQGRPFDSSTHDIEIVVLTEAYAQSFKVRVSEWTTLASMKNVIYGARPAFFPSCQESFLNGNQLADEDLFLNFLGNPSVDSDEDNSYNIDIPRPEHCGHAVPQLQGQCTTVRDVKQMLQGRIQIISFEMALLFNGNHLRNEWELFDELEIPDPGTLHLAFLMFGSGKKIKKDDVVMKQGMISERKEAITKQCAELHVEKFADIPVKGRKRAASKEKKSDAQLMENLAGR
ncbi:unnamed protein product, partial [Symbiodinium sp. KB8]